MREGGRPSVTRLLICRVGTKVCGLKLGHVLETMRPLPIEPLSTLPPFVTGVAIIRGKPTPVVDAVALLGGARAPSGAQRLVLIDLGTRSAALLVDAVLGARAIANDALSELPAMLRRDPDGAYLAGLGELDSELLLVLEHARLVPDGAWQALEQAASS
jgi:purine-binding chemotaxis protein CheW